MGLLLIGAGVRQVNGTVAAIAANATNAAGRISATGVACRTAADDGTAANGTRRAGLIHSAAEATGRFALVSCADIA